ncbi:LD-carboxypeptidase [Arthrobacter citreus]|uniref:S66 peptidase family protein n=1 Tax=Arthrobacter TaxID=1663 RepID=UPI0012647330|nr:LD-carboxypeptidase [Arthrobacter gandavensis]
MSLGGPYPELAPLKPGDRVGLVATSGPPVPESLDRAAAVLEEWGLVPVPGKHLRDRHPRAAYLAGTDAHRAADLQDAWCDDSLSAVFIVRGGYGAVRILDLLDPLALAAARPKALIGSSDVTALHEYWAEQMGLATWFTPMIATNAFLDDGPARAGVREALFTPFSGREYTSAAATALVPGTAAGRLVGGNLALLAMTMGAHGRPKPSNAGCIALLEDVTEDVYKIDGMLQTLLRAGWFEGISGIALGSWKDCGDYGPIRDLCVELLAPLGVPLVEELGFGHCDGASSLPLGVPATLEAGPSPRLVLD